MTFSSDKVMLNSHRGYLLMKLQKSGVLKD